MHSYPAWKVWLVAIVCSWRIARAAKLYGDAPALQLSRNDRVAVTEADLGSVTAALDGRDPDRSSYLAEDRLVLRFHTVNSSSRRVTCCRSPGRGLPVALSHVPRTPGWVRAIGLKP